MKNRYARYLIDSETKKPIGENIQTMLICALFSISNYAITDETLNAMKVKKYARAILGILRIMEGGTWTTIHARWDMELFSYLFSSKDEDGIDDRKTDLANACTSILELKSKHFSLSVISALYDMAGESRILISIVNDVVRIPDYIIIDENAMYSIHAYYKAHAYYNLKMYNEALFESNEAIRINPNGVAALYNKGSVLANLGRFEEAIDCYDKVLEIDPKLVYALGNKGLTLSDLGKYQEAIEWYDKVTGDRSTVGLCFG